MYIPFTQVIDLLSQAYNDGYNKGREEAYYEQAREPDCAQAEQKSQATVDLGNLGKGSRR